eukprot:GHVR01041582.1.p1 GENE.GHVR01041582.1~~GHVR01041582.1.p1  ORF type:complete len:152 (+),score=25.42 GHVR01041582.1:65-520(+)
MGICGSKQTTTAPEATITSDHAIEPQRRRLSVSIAGNSHIKKELAALKKKQTDEYEIINSTAAQTDSRSASVSRSRKMSIFGAPATEAQQSFDNKNIRTSRSSDRLRSLGIGYACKKGLKPESPNQDDFFIIQYIMLYIYIYYFFNFLLII